MTNRDVSGFGLGLRPAHYPAILDGGETGVDWFEIISENYMVAGGRPPARAEARPDVHSSCRS